MKGIILLSPSHKSLFPLTMESSVAMLNFFDQPLIEFQIQYMKQQGIDEICVVGEEDDDALRKYLESTHSIPFRLLPAHGISIGELAAPYPICVLFGQLTLTDYPLKKLCSHPDSHTVTGIFSETDKQCQKGLFICPESSYSAVLSPGRSLVSSFSLQNIPLDIIRESGYFYTVSNLPEYLNALKEHLNRSNLPKQYHQSNGVIHSKNAFIELGAKIKPPVYLGDHVTIQKSAEILPYSVICSHSVIGENAKIANSVLFPYCRIKEHATVSGAVLGEGVTVAAKTNVTDGSVYSKKVTVSSQDATLTGNAEHFENLLSFTPSGVSIPLKNATRFLEILGASCGQLFARGIVGLFQDDSVAAQFLSHSLCCGLQSAGASIYRFPPCTLAMCRSACSFYHLKAGFYLYEKEETCLLMILDNTGTLISENTEAAIKNQLSTPETALQKQPLLKITETAPYQLYYFSEINRRLGYESVGCKLYAETSSPMLMSYLQKVANCHKITLISEPLSGVIGFRCNSSATDFTLYDENNTALSPRQKESIIAALMVAEGESNYVTTMKTPHVLSHYLQKNKVTPIESDEHPHILETNLQKIPLQYYLSNDPVYLIMKVLIYLKKNQLTLSRWIAGLPKSFLIEKTITAEEQLAEAVEHLLGIAQVKENGASHCHFSSKKGFTTIIKDNDNLKIVSESNQEEYAKELTDFYVKQCSKEKTK